MEKVSENKYGKNRNRSEDKRNTLVMCLGLNRIRDQFFVS